MQTNCPNIQEPENYLRSSMSQERLTALAQRLIERKIFKELKFDNVINDFVAQKVQKADI